ncbi:hypothetical protein ACFWOL_15200 [Streptomyces sp. NPDC058442]|uniref:hypothetical protein n=1 Tax=Streptomyces sp. NPDC058442 TaxID=3346503 RepID=UPI00364D1D94
MTSHPQLPSADDLTYAQHQGWACVWCGASLYTDRGGVSAGRAQGAHGFSIEVYACPGLCNSHRLPARPNPREHRGAGGGTIPAPGRCI